MIMLMNIYELSYKLKQELENEPCFQELLLLEKQMENDDEVVKLTYQKDMALLYYNDALKVFDKNSEEIRPFLQRLSEAKNNLNSHKIVKLYLTKYKEVRELTNEINNILFSDLSSKICEEKI